MTNVKISGLPIAGALTGAESVPAVQGGVTVKTTTAGIAGLVAAQTPSILVESGPSQKISVMTAGTPLAGTETVAMLQAGATVTTTVQEIANLANTGMTITSQSGTTYTLVLGDNQSKIQFTNASAVLVTIPPNASVAFPVGAIVNLQQYGAGTVTIAAGGGVTLHAAGGLVATNGQYALASLIKDATDTWSLAGNLA